MSEDSPDADSRPALCLHELIRARMRERAWSYTDLERASDSALTRGRWQQLGSGLQQRRFPDPETLTVISQVLEIDITTVVLATAQALGLDVHRQGPDFSRLLPQHTDRLSERMRDALLTVIRASVVDTSAHDGADLPGPEALEGMRLEWRKSSAPSASAAERPGVAREAESTPAGDDAQDSVHGQGDALGRARRRER